MHQARRPGGVPVEPVGRTPGPPASLAAPERSSTLGWERYTGRKGLHIGLDRSGASAPAEDLFKRFGFTAEAIMPRVIAALETMGELEWQ